MKLPRALAWVVLSLPLAARASFLSGEALDSAANVLSWIVIFLVPALAIGLFLFVHVLPEKIAEKRQHPHKDSIKVLCILSLFFGGLLWPLAWLWAYTKPIGYRAIYGSEKHDDYYLEEGEKALAGKLSHDEVEHLRLELAAMQAKGPLPPELRQLAERLNQLAPPRAATPPVLTTRAAQPAEALAGGSK